MRFNYKFENKKGMMPYKYDNGKIYKITSKQTDKIYIGSTIRSLSYRITEHKSDIKRERYKCISGEILKYGDYEISLIENYPCNNVDELRKRESWYQTNTLNCININLARRTRKQYFIDNKEKLYGTYTCICGASMQFQAKTRHEKTIKHKKYIKNLT